MERPWRGVSITLFDKEHTHSNIFFHMSDTFLEGMQDENGNVYDVKAVDSYGYYSHRIPKNIPLSKRQKFLNSYAKIDFGLEKTYAQMRQEKITDLDGFGITGGHIIELTEEEYKNLLESIHTQMAYEKKYFAEADEKAQQLIDSMIFTNDKEKEKKHEEVRLEFRENHYQKNNDENIAPFNFTFGPNGRTCKILGLKKIEKVLPEDYRKEIISELINGSMTSPIPRMTPGVTKMIFNSKQDRYQKTSKGLPLPDRSWETTTKCSLIAYKKNTYINVNGEEKTLRIIDNEKHFNKKYFNVLENLMFLKRLLNDFTFNTEDDDQLLNDPSSAKPDYQIYIKIIDATIDEIVDDADDINRVMRAYKDGCKRLAEFGCFDKIAKEILETDKNLLDVNVSELLQKHKKVEDSVRVEFDRLKTIYQDATNKTSNVYSIYRMFHFLKKEISEVPNLFRRLGSCCTK